MNRIARVLGPLFAAMACGGHDTTSPPGDEPDHHEDIVIESIPYDAIGHARIAFKRFSSTGSGIVILDGSARRATTHLGHGDAIEVSPDGTRVVYLRETALDHAQRLLDVNVSDLDSPARTELGGSGGVRTYPSWMPDGSTVMYTETDDRFATTPAVRIVTQLPSPGSSRQILWQSSGGCESAGAPHANNAGEIVFVYYPSPSDCLLRDARIARKKPGLPLEILYGSGTLSPSAPAWSPTGTEIAFVEGGRMGPQVSTYLWDIKAMSADGSNLRTVATVVTPGAGFSLCWGADGSTLFFALQDSHIESHIYAVPATGGTVVQITTQIAAKDLAVSCLR